MNLVSKLLITLMLVTLLTACFFSNTYRLREGIQHFRVAEYRKAFIYLRPEAERGQRDAQYAIGYMYYYGKGVVEDRKKAWFWINVAANAGQPDAKVAFQMLDRNMNTK
jgi:TPR repeat protein